MFSQRGLIMKIAMKRCILQYKYTILKAVLNAFYNLMCRFVYLYQ